MEFEILLSQIREARKNPDLKDEEIRLLERDFIRLILEGEDRLIM